MTKKDNPQLETISFETISKVVDNCTTPKQTINISAQWEYQLPQYAQLYSRLTEQGKKEMIKQLTVIGKIVDKCKQLKGKNE